MGEVVRLFKTESCLCSRCFYRSTRTYSTEYSSDYVGLESGQGPTRAVTTGERSDLELSPLASGLHFPVRYSGATTPFLAAR